jgi:hypothetical protein
MKTISGSFNGTGADLYICLGFVPDFVKIKNNEGTQILELDWNIEMMRVAEVSEGNQIVGSSSTVTALTAGAGILPYYGRETLTSTMAGTVTYGEGVYLKRDDKDYREGGDDGDAVSDTINAWTLTSGYTGYFNEDVTGTYIGEGSFIIIDGLRYAIQSLTAGQGEAAGEVTISHTGIHSGLVEYISGKYGYKPMVAAETTKEGFLISNTTINVNDEMCSFVAGTYAK